MDLAVGCFHCGEALPASAPQVEIDGARRAVCCEGCAAAARWIRDAGLMDYYRLRESDATRVAADIDDYEAWAHPDVLAEHARPAPGGLEITVLTDAMRCAACAWLIDRALARERGVGDISANAVTGRIRFTWNPTIVALPVLLRQLATLGFAPHLATGTTREDASRRVRRRDLLRLGVAGLGAMQAMMFAEALYLDVDSQMPLATRDFLRWITFLVSTPVVFFSGWPFLAGMAREWRERRPGMDVLVATSILLAYGASLVETVRGGAHVWFDAAVMFVLLLLTARQLEAWARRRASAVVDALARARPALARREEADGRVHEVAVMALRPDDVVRVAVGEALPADGLLLGDVATLDESLLTGEATPALRRAGDELVGGSLCRESPLRMRVTHTGQDTRLSQLVRLLERAQEERPRVARIADRIASRFVVALLVLATVVFALWWQVEPSRAFETMLAVLVVSCPCALSLAVPAALASAHGQLARLGVMSLHGDALETLANADMVLMDKTGTLTTERPTLAAMEVFAGMDRARARRIAAALQRESGHPLAHAFADQEGGAIVAMQVRVDAGLGVQGTCDGRTYRLGRADFAAACADDGAIWLGADEAPLARFTLRHALRADARDAVAQLRDLGLAMELSSGDGEDAVLEVARLTDIGVWRARQSPQDKLARLRQLQAEGHVVAMLGDGINDAPVLAGADVSFALAGGAALAHRAADFVVVGESLRRVPQAVGLARRTRRIVRQNLAWAIAYNLVALPFAALGWVPPWLAAVGMALSSLLVTLNALRLARAPA